MAKLTFERIEKCIRLARILDIQGPYFLYCSIAKMGGYWDCRRWVGDANPMHLSLIRHAGLDPASIAAPVSWTPDQVRGDERGVAFLVSLRLHARVRSPIPAPPRTPKSYFAHPTPKTPFLHYLAMLQTGG
ncbi:hypothetical protein E5675_03915 [Sphingopyxis sp. PAMC25046]|nr:hypothetical protein E5675_03915 [Sphingopyxis sp. PAMC25046]